MLERYSRYPPIPLLKSPKFISSSYYHYKQKADFTEMKSALYST